MCEINLDTDIFCDYVELLSLPKVKGCVNYAAFRIEEAIFKCITGNAGISISWNDFMVKIRDTVELTSLINDIIAKSLYDVKAEQYDFKQTERPIAWLDKTSHDYESFISPSHDEKGIGCIWLLMYRAERIFYKESGGLENKAMWMKFCGEIISNKTLYYKIHRGFLHALAGIDFEKYIPDTDTLLALFV